MSATLTFYGHATHGLEIDGIKIVIDPFFTGNPQASIGADEVRELDYILITHGHGDHIGDAVELAKRTGAKVVANFEIVNWLQAQGVENLHAQHIGGAYDHDFGNLKFTTALHGSGLPDGSYGGSPAGFRIKAKSGETFYFAGDTGLFSDMSLIGDEGIDIAVLPIGDNFTMGPEDALKAVGFVRPKVTIPCHYNTWPPIEVDADAWAASVRETTESRVEILQPGQSVDVATLL